MNSLINKVFSEYGPYTLLLIIFLFSVLQSFIQILVQLFFSNKANKQLEVYKIITGGNLNRKTRFIEKEYVALSECWSSFTKAYDNIKFAGYRLYPAYNLCGMDDEELEIFLRKFEFSNDQISEMKKSNNKNKDFFKIDGENFFKISEELLNKFRDTLYANEIFMEEDLLKKFYNFLSIFDRALLGWKMQERKKGGNTLLEEAQFEEAQKAISLLFQKETIQDRNELLSLVKKSLQKDDFVSGKKKTQPRIASFFCREKVKVRK